MDEACGEEARSLIRYQRNLDVSTIFQLPESKAPETLGISGAWQSALGRAKGNGVEPGRVLRHPVESIYSIIGITAPGPRLDDVSVIDSLAKFAAGQS